MWLLYFSSSFSAISWNGFLTTSRRLYAMFLPKISKWQPLLSEIQRPFKRFSNAFKNSFQSCSIVKPFSIGLQKRVIEYYNKILLPSYKKLNWNSFSRRFNFRHGWNGIHRGGIQHERSGGWVPAVSGLCLMKLQCYPTAISIENFHLFIFRKHPLMMRKSIWTT